MILVINYDIATSVGAKHKKKYAWDTLTFVFPALGVPGLIILRNLLFSVFDNTSGYFKLSLLLVNSFYIYLNKHFTHVWPYHLHFVDFVVDVPQQCQGHCIIGNQFNIVRTIKGLFSMWYYYRLKQLTNFLTLFFYILIRHSWINFIP